MASFSLFVHNYLITTSPDAENAPIILTGVLLSLVFIYIASKVGGEICNRINLPPVLGELMGGVIIGISFLHIIVLPESGATASDSLIMTILQKINHLTPEAISSIFYSNSEVISVLGELGVIILLFEIGLESDIRELQKVGYQAILVGFVGVVAPFAGGTIGLMALFHVPAIPV